MDEQEAAVVTMFGNVIRTDTAGLYFKIPLIQQVRKVDTTIHGTGIGYAIEGDGQTFTVDTEGIMITSDFNLIDIDFYMEYRVSDPIAYLYNSGQPELILKNIALAAIRSTVIDYTVDDAMTTGKAQIQAEVKAKIQETLEEQNIGLSIVNITVQDAEPPTREYRMRSRPPGRSSVHSKRSRQQSRARIQPSTTPINTRMNRSLPRKPPPIRSSRARKRKKRRA